jgi:hypothetical protein
LRAQDAKIVADNLEYSREFYSGVHFSAITESQPSFGYQRYPDNGPERIQCDDGTFARKERGRPWLNSLPRCSGSIRFGTIRVSKNSLLRPSRNIDVEALATCAYNPSQCRLK